MNKLPITLTVLALGFSVATAQNTFAATVNLAFEGTSDFGPLLGQSYQGTASYNDMSLTGSGEEFVAANNFSLSFNGQTFDNANAAPGGMASAYFFDGAFLGIQYSSQTVADLSVSLVAGLFDTSDASFAYTLSGQDGSGSVNYTPVPEPATVLGLLAFGTGLLVTKGKKQS